MRAHACCAATGRRSKDCMRPVRSRGFTTRSIPQGPPCCERSPSGASPRSKRQARGVETMDVVHAAQMPWGESLVAQREGGEAVGHKRLFEGVEHSPDNYMLVMSKE